jgi:diguanylate cyclase (GGDEF)-like protein
LENIVLVPEGTTSVSEMGIPEPTGWEDPVTGLEGPDFWYRLLASELARSARYRRPLTVVLLDVEGMRELQVVWGADVAQQTLRETAQCVQRMGRSSDHCTRIGPVRFGILLTETDEIAAINFVERVREAGPRALPRVADQVRFTFGWASPHPGEAAEAVIGRAEALMAEDRAF